MSKGQFTIKDALTLLMLVAVLLAWLQLLAALIPYVGYVAIAVALCAAMWRVSVLRAHTGAELVVGAVKHMLKWTYAFVFTVTPVVFLCLWVGCAGFFGLRNVSYLIYSSQIDTSDFDPVGAKHIFYCESGNVDSRVSFFRCQLARDAYRRLLRQRRSNVARMPLFLPVGSMPTTTELAMTPPTWWQPPVRNGIAVSRDEFTDVIQGANNTQFFTFLREQWIYESELEILWVVSWRVQCVDDASNRPPQLPELDDFGNFQDPGS